ncbi:tetratricopeptide repeat protein [Streptomyces tubercidicus]|uniref:tetratricopeptide repeat protein n=1 Tax=Streptomyces tubercidicus TaxID=47759 RepID=UPI0036B46E9F
MVDQKITVLPFHAQHWIDFELLLLDTVIETEGLLRALRYGGPGQDQGGIDIAGVRPDGTWHAYQAKKVERFLESDVRKAVEAFVSGRRPFGAKRLVIATACSVTRTQVRDLLHESQKRHTDLVLEQVWDAEHLSRLLRPHPRIVARFFGEDVARRFCDADALRDWTPTHPPSEDCGTPCPVPPGQPLSSFSDPFSLEVHEAIRPVHGADELPALPAYVRRSHDEKLQVAVDLALSGSSSMAVLLGDSSTGKTRAAWEAIQRLPKDWKLWHPSTQASLTDSLDAVEPRTVLWLNEIHRFLITTDEAQDERTAGELRRILSDPTRAPVLILGTVWHEYWTELVRKPGTTDERRESRSLLENCRILVPETFSTSELTALKDIATADPRLKEAIDHAEDGHVTQYLAGGPAQLDRYELAAPAARAVLHAAMDARRLGHGLPLSRPFLMQAAEPYLTGPQRDALRDDWFDAALAYLSPPCRGARGALAPIRPSPDDPPDQGTRYRLADYLEQHSKRYRSTVCPPDAFWAAAEQYAMTAADRSALALAAHDRGRSAAAERLAKSAASLGNSTGLTGIARRIKEERGTREALPYFLLAAEAGDNDARIAVAWQCEQDGRIDEAEAWYRAAAEGGYRAPALVGLASIAWERGDESVAMRLYTEALETGGARSVEYQARYLAGRGGDQDHALRLAHMSFKAGNTEAFTGLAWTYMNPEQKDIAIRVFLYAAAEAGDTNALRELAWLFEGEGDSETADHFCELAVRYGEAGTPRGLGQMRASRGDRRAAAGLFWRARNAGDPWAVFKLAELREEDGDLKRARRLYERMLSEGQSYGLTGLVRIMEKSGQRAEAEKLAWDSRRFPHSYAWEELVRVRERAGDIEGAERLLRMALEDGDIRSLLSMGELRVRADDRVGAERFLRQAVEAGVHGANRRLSEFLGLPENDEL